MYFLYQRWPDNRLFFGEYYGSIYCFWTVISAFVFIASLFLHSTAVCIFAVAAFFVGYNNILPRRRMLNGDYLSRKRHAVSVKRVPAEGFVTIDGYDYYSRKLEWYEKEKKAKNLGIKLLCVVMVLFCIFGIEACIDYKNSPPEITGTADDGLFLYLGNGRYTSDLRQYAQLVTEVNIGGETYTVFHDEQDIQPQYAACYQGDYAWLILNIRDRENGEGQCLVKYGLETEKCEVLYHWWSCRSELLYCGEENGVILLSLYDHLCDKWGVYRVENGDVRRYGIPSEICAFTERGLVYAKENTVFLRGWDTDYYESILELPDKVSFLKTAGNAVIAGIRYSHGAGLYAYNTVTGERLVLAEASDGVYAQINCNQVEFYDLYYIRCSFREIVYNTKENPINGFLGENCELRRFNAENFTDESVYVFEKTDREYKGIAGYPARYIRICETRLSWGGLYDAEYYYDIETNLLKKGRSPELNGRVFVAENENYLFYYTYKNRMVGKYCVFCRLNKETGRDDIMFYTMKTDRFFFHAVR